MSVGLRVTPRGPFRADQLHPGDRYELSHGHAIYCPPTSGRCARAISLGAAVIDSDPLVEESGVNVGYELAPDTLRAPDVAVGNVSDQPGWVKGVPSLAIQYADEDRDEVDLQEKIRDLLSYGTRFLWVVRLSEPRRVEVHEPGKKVQIVLPGDILRVPEVLQNEVRVEALYDRDEAERATLRNLLQRFGQEDLGVVLEARRREANERGVLQGSVEALFALLDARGLDLDKEARERIEACTDLQELHRWIRRTVRVQKTSEIFESA